MTVAAMTLTVAAVTGFQTLSNIGRFAQLFFRISIGRFSLVKEFTCSLSDGFPEDVEHRNQEQSDTTRGDHADEHRRANGLARDLRCAAMNSGPLSGTQRRMVGRHATHEGGRL